jgi:diguanylate cyclase (GGDEF)-like protein/PAS domain S-box-containing protein
MASFVPGDRRPPAGETSPTPRLFEHALRSVPDATLTDAVPPSTTDVATRRGTGTARDPERVLWHELFDQNPAILLLVDPVDGRIVEASATASRFYGYSRNELLGMRIDQINMQSADAIAAGPAAATSGPATRNDRFPHRLASGEIRMVDMYSGPIRFGGRTLLQSVIHDVTELVHAEAERDRLAAAVEHAVEAVVITDPGARIVYVNPAFERISGYSRSEALGANPRILKSGQQTAATYTAMWATLTAGRTWHGELVNRRKDGTLFVEETSITPVHGHDGTLLHYVGVKRDVTVARALEGRLDDSPDERAAISAMVADLIPGESPEATAAAICDRVLTLPRVAFASLALFLPGDRVRSLAAVGLDRLDVPPVDPGWTWSAPLRRRVRYLREQARLGTAIEPWPGEFTSPMGDTFARLGISALALAPVRVDGEPIGFLQVGVAGANPQAAITAVLPTVTAFGVLASLLLAPQVVDRTRDEHRRDVIKRIIERHAFRPVFQPIVSLSTGSVVGFEALTRFSDGTPPQQQFAAAAAAGLGVDLELATLEAAISAAASLPMGTWLDLNASSSLLEDPTRVAHLLWKAGSRSIVLEITEHDHIGDYAQLREKLEAVGIPIRLAVDDAGAGFASLRHILELRPNMIKLDRSLIAAIDSDPVRQGLVAGLTHFASVAGATVIAEGIETHAESAALTALGVELGQGYLFGKPRPVAQVRRTRFPAADRRVIPVSPEPVPPVDAPDLVHRVNAILWEADGTDERMTFVSEGAVSLTGHPASRWLMEPRFWEDHIHPDERAAVVGAIGDAIGDGRRVSLEYRFRMADGTYRWFEDLVEILPGQDGHTRLVGVMIDVTHRRRLEEQLAYRASHDSLTGLLNREGFQTVLARTLPNCREGSCAVLFFDLDDFKLVNDSLGHRAGDELLRFIAARLRASVRASDAVARFGGDEFLVLATADEGETLIELGKRLLDLVAEPSEIAGRGLAHPVSAGIAFVTPRDTPETAVRNADLAMYAAKRAGGNTLRPYDPKMHEAAVGRLDRIVG